MNTLTNLSPVTDASRYTFDAMPIGPSLMVLARSIYTDKVTAKITARLMICEGKATFDPYCVRYSGLMMLAPELHSRLVTYAKDLGVAIVA